MSEFHNFEKKDILEVVSEYVDLSPPMGGKRKYHTGLCPFHDDKKPSFAVFEASQHWECFSCSPKGGDVIDFIRRLKGVGFEEAKRICCEPVPATAVALRQFEHAQEKEPDLSMISERLRKVFDRLDYDDALSVHSDVDAYLETGRFLEADRYLKHRNL